MKKVTITLSDDTWKWWKANPWINLSQLTERELNRINFALMEKHITAQNVDMNINKIYNRITTKK